MFFDGLKTNAIENALKNAKPKNQKQLPIIKEMERLNKESKELDDWLEKNS